MNTSSGTPRVALVTGGSRGLGRALLDELVWRGWHVVTDARDGDALATAVASTSRPERVRAIVGDVADATHRRALAEAVEQLGRLDLLVNNASTLGGSPPPRLEALDGEHFADILAVNLVAPLALIARLMPRLEASGGRVVNVSSDAAVGAYEGWGAYGASKAALDHLTATIAAEHPAIRAYAFDPGDMATHMHQEAFPDADLSDLPAPESVVPAFMRTVDGDLPSARYRAVDLASVNA
jgi:NAD(P)-dependent dehydrogenase (short-subunit alcohol dehydrogenase family)